MAKYGYIGAVPTQSNSSNTGLFNMTDVFKLIEAGQWALQGMDISYLVIAGGGGASTANSSGNRPGGGGGAGGYRNSYASESSGRNSATETPLFAGIGASLQVTVGGGGSANDGNYNRAGAKGSDSVFSTITSEGGGGCRSTSNGDEDGGSGAGGFNGTRSNPGEGTAGQGFDGGTGSNTAGYSGGAGGGAGGNGGNTIHFQSGTVSPGAGLSSSITGSSVLRAKGGQQGKQGGNGTNGLTNKGYGAGSSGSTNSGNGGSGVVILRYSNEFTITVGAGLTSSTSTDGSDKVTTFTAGSDTVSFS